MRGKRPWESPGLAIERPGSHLRLNGLTLPLFPGDAAVSLWGVLKVKGALRWDQEREWWFKKARIQTDRSLLHLPGILLMLLRNSGRQSFTHSTHGHSTSDHWLGAQHCCVEGGKSKPTGPCSPGADIPASVLLCHRIVPKDTRDLEIPNKPIDLALFFRHGIVGWALFYKLRLILIAIWPLGKNCHDLCLNLLQCLLSKWNGCSQVAPNRVTVRVPQTEGPSMWDGPRLIHSCQHRALKKRGAHGFLWSHAGRGLATCFTWSQVRLRTLRWDMMVQQRASFPFDRSFWRSIINLLRDDIETVF